MRDPYLFEDVDVIKNKLGIKDNDKLEAAESDIVPIKLMSVDKFIEGEFRLEKLKLIHKYIFGDLYEWAGETRKMDIEKSEAVLSGLSVQYCNYKYIEREVKNIINKMNKVDWKDLDIDRKAEEISKLTAELWQIHSFREGNTRTTITFMELFAASKGINIDRELLKYNSGYVRNSLVLASIGEYSEHSHLIRIIKDSIKENFPAKENRKKLSETINKAYKKTENRNEEAFKNKNNIER